MKSKDVIWCQPGLERYHEAYPILNTQYYWPPATPIPNTDTDTEYNVIRCTDTRDVNGYPGSRDPNLLHEPG